MCSNGTGTGYCLLHCLLQFSFSRKKCTLCRCEAWKLLAIGCYLLVIERLRPNGYKKTDIRKLYITIEFITYIGHSSKNFHKSFTILLLVKYTYIVFTRLFVLSLAVNRKYTYIDKKSSISIYQENVVNFVSKNTSVVITSKYLPVARWK